MNVVHLIWFVSQVTGESFEEIEGYVEELMKDEGLRDSVREATSLSPRRYLADKDVAFGRRVGWYSFVRAIRPGVVVETGTDKGLGSVVLASALLKNAEEGHPGRLISIDINPDAGYLVTGRYAEVAELRTGNSLDHLAGLDERVDLFLHDSDHSPAHEFDEYRAVSDRLSATALILSDNAHVTGKLSDFAKLTGRTFLFFGERPRDHWYPGGGIGAAWSDRK